VKTIWLGLFLLGALTSVSSVQAQLIGINFEGGGGIVTDPTGAVTIFASSSEPIDFWNEASGNSGTISNLLETDGTPDSAGSENIAGLTAVYSAPGAFQTGNTNLGNLMNGYLDGNGAGLGLENGIVSVTLTNIPFTTYDVYAYVDSDHDGRPSTASIGSETLSFTTAGTAASASGVGLPGDFTVNSDPTADHPAVQAILFTNVTGSTFTYLQNGGSNNSSTGLAGIEIVQVPDVPEPATWATMALSMGVLGLVLIVRRKASVI
jgi:hypothetical protein